MPVSNFSTPTVNVQVPVPTPVPTRKKPKVSRAPIAPPPAPARPPAPPPISFGAEQDDSQQMMPTGHRGLTAVVLPWATPQKPRQMKRGGNPQKYAVYTTEEDFHKALDANPDDHVTRQVFADFLDEQGDPRAEGYRAMGQLGKRPYIGEARPYAEWTHKGNDLAFKYPDAALPNEWFARVAGDHVNTQWWRTHSSRRHAEDTAALAFGKLSPEVQSRILSVHKLSRRPPRRYEGATTEEDFHKMLDANPDDHHTRLVFADWLQDRDDPRAEGYRAMGQLQRRPYASVHRPDSPVWLWGGSHNPAPATNHGFYPQIALPRQWLQRIEGTHPTYGQNVNPEYDYWRYHNSRREAEDRAALAFGKLPPKVKERILKPKGPKKKSRDLRPHRYAVKKPESLANASVMFPEELSDIAGANKGTISEMNKGIRQGQADKPGFQPTSSEIESLANMGEAVKGGYAEQGRGMEELLGNPTDATHWIHLNAIMSPQSYWVGHSAGALQALSLWKEQGKPTDAKSLEKIFGTTYQERVPGSSQVVTKWGKNGDFYNLGVPSGLMLSGSKINKVKDYLSQEEPEDVQWGRISESAYKTPNFGLAFRDPRGVPLDTHMARLLSPGGRFSLANIQKLMGQTSGSTGALKEYKLVRDKIINRTPVALAYKTLVGDVAQKMGWEPRQVQEAVWTSIVGIIVAKHLGATNDAKGIQSVLSNRALQSGWSLAEVIANKNAYDSLLRAGVKPRRIRNVLATSQKRTPVKPGKVRVSDPAAIESAASRLGGPVPDAGNAIRDAVRAGYSRSGQQVRQTPQGPKRYVRPEGLDHTPFHNQIAVDINTERGQPEKQYTSKDGTSSLVYADFLEENGMPHAAAFVRASANNLMGRGTARFPDSTAIMRYDNTYGKVTQPLTVQAYTGLGQYGPRVRGRRPKPTMNVQLNSPHPNDPNKQLTFNLDVPIAEGSQWLDRLLSEGHPVVPSHVVPNTYLHAAVQRHQQGQAAANPQTSEPPAQMSRRRLSLMFSSRK